MAKRPRRSKKRRRKRRRRRAPRASTPAAPAQDQQQTAPRQPTPAPPPRHRFDFLTLARIWLIVAPLAALIHVAAEWPGAVVLQSLAVVGGLIGLAAPILGIIFRRPTVTFTGTACLAILPLLVTVVGRGASWPDRRLDWFSLALAVLILVALGTYDALRRLVNSRPNHQVRTCLQRLAIHFHGEYLPEYPRVVFLDKHKRIVIAPQIIDREENRLVVEVTAPWIDKHLRLEVYPAGMFARLKDLLGMEDVPIGHTEFDRIYTISSNSPEKAVAILQEDVRGRIERFRQQDPDFYLAIIGGQFVLKINTTIDRASLVEVTYAALKLYRIAVASRHPSDKRQEQPPDVEIVETGTEPICQICGGAIHGEHAECRRCRTPHHIDCWDYLGGCSTYGCGNDSYRRRKGFK